MWHNRLFSCKPVRIPLDIFSNIHHLPDPTPSEDGHYAPFSEVYESSTIEQYRPSAQVKEESNQLFHFQQASSMLKMLVLFCNVRNAKNGDFSTAKRKLTTPERCELLHTLDYVTYSCGAQLEDLVDPGRQFGDVFCG